VGVKQSENTQEGDIIAEARKFLQILQQSSEYESMKYADEILVYLYNLQDHYTILKTKSPRFSQGKIRSLGDLIYQLESKPEESFRSSELKNFLILALEDIALGRVEAALNR